ncbi:alpha/beta hydrolase [Aestuariivita sp.]|jgi:pimeloyl-ACP methyl ester carboxylesterase|uniref:alpha/beta fold hydrolase n=1 Tax=Aestuariivita sp. TaxID=1872407 RepID=UPI00217216D3|nr:alpha/beta hydrolase [Aestuariivita sp.]MCE8008432.1 alpha/beta hydrolase [Aestuariivita sp.]
MREIWHNTSHGPVFARHWGAADAPVLLMLHGFPEFGGAWEALALRLADRFHCIAPDQRGYGRTGGPDDVRAYTASALTRDMAELVTGLGSGPVTVLGHDWGAAVAYGLAMWHAPLVARLIIANGVHPVPFQRALAAGGAQAEASQYILWLRQDGSEDALAENDFAKLKQLFSAHMDMSWLTGDTLEAYHTEWARPGRMKTMVHWYRASPLIVAEPGVPHTDLPDFPLDRLQVRQPHLLIWGENDTALLPEATDGLEDFAPDLTRVTLAGADHWLAHQKPDRLAQIIAEWCADRRVGNT